MYPRRAPPGDRIPEAACTRTPRVGGRLLCYLAALLLVPGCRDSRLLAATSDRWWGVETDELDVPYIVRYDVGPRTL